MGFKGRWVSEEGYELYVKTCSTHEIEGRMKLSGNFKMSNSGFNGMVLFENDEKIDFCFWMRKQAYQGSSTTNIFFKGCFEISDSTMELMIVNYSKLKEDSKIINVETISLRKIMD